MKNQDKKKLKHLKHEDKDKQILSVNKQGLARQKELLEKRQLRKHEIRVLFALVLGLLTAVVVIIDELLGIIFVSICLCYILYVYNKEMKKIESWYGGNQ